MAHWRMASPMKARMLVRWIALWMGALCFIAPLAHAEDCPAPKEWFAAGGTPPPSNAEPKRGNDCEFYQWAWQTFLFVTGDQNGSPRFLNYKSYVDVFGQDRKGGFQAASSNLMVLAPRLVKPTKTTPAEDLDRK